MRGESRAPAEISALWLCGARAPETERIAAALRLLIAASEHARGRWPRIFGRPAGARIICPAAQAPPGALIEAAEAAGCALSIIDSPADLLLAQCDLAIVESSADLPRAGLLPALIVPATTDSIFGFDKGGPRPLAAATRRNEEALSSVTPESIAAAALTPPRGRHEALGLVDYLAEDF